MKWKHNQKQSSDIVKELMDSNAPIKAHRYGINGLQSLQLRGFVLNWGGITGEFAAYSISLESYTGGEFGNTLLRPDSNQGRVSEEINRLLNAINTGES